MIGAPAMDIELSRTAVLENAADRKLSALRKPAGKTNDPAAVQKTAKDFETVFLEQMFNHMFSTVGVDKVTGGGMGEETTRSMLVNAYAKTITQTGGIGLAPTIANEIIKLQEKADGIAR